MRVTAKEVLAAWVELDREAPYHTEQKPIGHDRKHHEGPLATNEDFPNSWLPTEKMAPEKEQCAVEQIEVLTVEVAGMRHADVHAIPGVPMSVFKAWEVAHDAEMDFYSSTDVNSLQGFIDSLLGFVQAAGAVGLRANPDHVEQLKNYTKMYRPDRGDAYSLSRAEEVLRKLDKVLGNIHSEVARLTHTQKDDWYEYQAEQMKKQKVRPLSEPALQPEQLRERRGPMAPFYEDIWRRKKRHELTGMRVTAIDVKRKRKAPKVQEPDSFDQAIDQTVQELDAPQPQAQPEKWQPATHPAVYDTNQMAYGDPAILGKTIGDFEWSEQEEGTGVEGAIFSYEKRIELVNDDTGDNTLEIYAFVEPLIVRKRRTMEQAKRERGYARGGWGDESAQKARKLQQEAEGMPSAGYINDIEVFYKSNLLFHRERSFRPQTAALTKTEFMAGDSMQRAITDLQQFVRTKIDPIPLGQFIEAALKNPGKGEAKLSHVVAKKGDPKKPLYAPVVDWLDHRKRKRTPGYIMQQRPWNKKREMDLFEEKESMRITSAEVIPFDPRRRKGPQRSEPTVSPEMEQAFQEDAGMMQGDVSGDVEALFYFYDNIAGSLSDVRDQMVSAVQAATPEQKGELARLIRNIERAIQFLGQ